MEERRIVFVGRLEKDINKNALRAQFVKFGPVTEVRLHSKEDGLVLSFSALSSAVFYVMCTISAESGEWSVMTHKHFNFK